MNPNNPNFRTADEWAEACERLASENRLLKFELESKHRPLSEQVLELASANNALSAKCAELESRMADMVPNDDLTMQRVKTASQMLKNSELMDEVESLRAQLADAKEDAAINYEARTHTEAQLAASREETVEFCERWKGLQAKLSEKERELAEVKLKLENIAIEKLNDNRDMKIRVLESQNADLQRCCDLHDVRVAERNEAREMLAEKERELAEVKAYAEAYKKERDVERDWRAGVQNHLDAANAKVAELEKQLGEKDAEIERLKGTSDMRFRAMDSLAKELDEKDLKFDALFEDWVKMKAALESTASTGCYHCSGDASETLADLKYKGE